MIAKPTVPIIVEANKSDAAVEAVMTVQPRESKQPYNAAVDILDKAFGYFNEKLFDSCIDTRPIITIQSKGRKNAYGWFWAGKWTDGDDNRCEINISAEELARTAMSIFETLIHEMVHQYNWQQSISDCSDNGYHNKHFKVTCEDVSLECEKMQNYGWAKTSLGEKASTVVNEFIEQNDCKVFDTFKRVERRRHYRKVWTVPVSEEAKNWIERKAVQMLVSQKYLIEYMISLMPAIEENVDNLEQKEEENEEENEAQVVSEN